MKHVTLLRRMPIFETPDSIPDAKVLLWGEPGYGLARTAIQIADKYAKQHPDCKVLVIPNTTAATNFTLAEWKIHARYCRSIEIAPSTAPGISKAIAALRPGDVVVAHLTYGVRKTTRERIYEACRKTGAYCITHWEKQHGGFSSAEAILFAHEQLPEATQILIAETKPGRYIIYPGAHASFEAGTGNDQK